MVMGRSDGIFSYPMIALTAISESAASHSGRRNQSLQMEQTP
jgi:hypothetical protein